MIGPLTKERAPSEAREQVADGEAARPRRGILRAAIVAMRPQEWVKNLLVFAGLLFSAKFREFDAIVDKRSPSPPSARSPRPAT
jgi:hypothetical protein